MRRRTVVRGAVWSTPVVLATTAAPAFAASPCVGFAYPAPNAGTWSRVSTRVTQDAGNAFTSTGYVLTSDPTSGDLAGLTPASVVVTGPSVTFTLGRTYRISYDYSLRTINPRDLSLSITVGGVTQAAGALTTTGAADNSTGTIAFDYTPTSTAALRIVLNFQFASGSLSTVGDDMTISNFAVACRPAGT